MCDSNDPFDLSIPGLRRTDREGGTFCQTELRRSLDPARLFRAEPLRPSPTAGDSSSKLHFGEPFRRVELTTMADSDEEYVGGVTDDEDDLQVTRTDPSQPRKRKQRGAAEWELSRTWETLVEGADGTISSTVEGLLEASKRKRFVEPFRRKCEYRCVFASTVLIVRQHE